MLLVLTGPSCSGKTTMQKEVHDNAGYAIVRTATTRPRRMGEEFDAYYFVKDQTFTDWEARKDLLCVETFRGWRYGIPREELERIPGRDNRCAVLTVGGVYQLLTKHTDIIVGDALSILYLGVDGRTAEARALRRGDSRREYLRRMAADSVDFRFFPKENKVYEFTPEYILKVINGNASPYEAPELREVKK